GGALARHAGRSRDRRGAGEGIGGGYGSAAGFGLSRRLVCLPAASAAAKGAASGSLWGYGARLGVMRRREMPDDRQRGGGGDHAPALRFRRQVGAGAQATGRLGRGARMPAPARAYSAVQDDIPVQPDP